MASWDKLDRPYDRRVLIEAFIFTRRKDFVHEDFNNYYDELLKSLQLLFGVDMSVESLTFDQRIVWSLFRNTVDSLLQITNPWAGYLEAGLVHNKLSQHKDVEQVVDECSQKIREANRLSEDAHRDMLSTLFVAIFGDLSTVVTSEELRQAGVDDSREPDITDYYDYV